ncbi:MAG: radical SAM family heme chaperone HemW [Ktedonobacterales bacterium]|nr:radical SAM family heme chaperone HemW [Ktedonobacterales bacterium]
MSGTPASRGVPPPRLPASPAANHSTEDNPGAEASLALSQTISLYLHIPFCHAKCPYCDFNTYAGMLDLAESYVAALVEEIALAGAAARHAVGQRRRCRTIFFGGGTPSLLTAAQVAAILSAARRAFIVDADAEVSLEAKPGRMEYSHLDELRGAGITRLSMGAQSFDAALLRWLGRIHSPDEIETAFHAARAAGFTSVNLDFMYALPGQSLTTWAATLERAVSLGPDHLSLYSLIVEEGTPLHRWVRQGKVRPADQDIAADMYELAEARLDAADYDHYEISNWARPGHACQHNLTYWHNLPYLGLGAGAHGWFAGHRYAEARPIRDYIARVRAAVAGATPLPLPAAAVAEDEVISLEMAMAETAILTLRLADGLDLRAFERRFSRPFWSVYGARVDELRTFGLIELAGERLRLTPRGRLLGNEVFERLLPEGATTA